MKIPLFVILSACLSLAWAQAPGPQSPASEAQAVTPAVPAEVETAPPTDPQAVAPAPTPQPTEPAAGVEMPALGAPSPQASALPEEGHWYIDAELWSRPRDAEAILSMASVRQAVQALEAQTAGRLLIRYPGGEEGSLWAAELRSWLIALGVPATRLEVQPGSPGDDLIDLTLEDTLR